MHAMMTMRRLWIRRIGTVRALWNPLLSHALRERRVQYVPKLALAQLLLAMVTLVPDGSGLSSRNLGKEVWVFHFRLNFLVNVTSFACVMLYNLFQKNVQCLCGRIYDVMQVAESRKHEQQLYILFNLCNLGGIQKCIFGWYSVRLNCLMSSCTLNCARDGRIWFGAYYDFVQLNWWSCDQRNPS